MNNEMFILGSEPIDYVSKKTGKLVKGCIVYVGQYIQNGTKSVANVYVAGGQCYDYPTGYECEIYYNKYGRPFEVSVTKFD